MIRRYKIDRLVMVAVIFGFTALLWMVRPLIESWLPGLSDAGIAIFGALLLFLVPVSIKTGRFMA